MLRSPKWATNNTKEDGDPLFQACKTLTYISHVFKAVVPRFPNVQGHPLRSKAPEPFSRSRMGPDGQPLKLAPESTVASNGLRGGEVLTAVAPLGLQRMTRADQVGELADPDCMGNGTKGNGLQRLKNEWKWSSPAVGRRRFMLFRDAIRPLKSALPGMVQARPSHGWVGASGWLVLILPRKKPFLDGWISHDFSLNMNNMLVNLYFPTKQTES